jgi:tetratricopeptide (TPR) repeat protein
MFPPFEDDPDQCSFCGKPFVATGSEKWRAPSGELIAIPTSDIAYTLSDTSKGEVYICEECYKKSDFKDLTSDDIAEIHYQFGLEYLASKQFSESVDALHQSLRLKVSPDTLASIARSYDELGATKLAIEFYQQALAIDPKHFMSRENLKLVLERL